MHCEIIESSDYTIYVCFYLKGQVGKNMTFLIMTRLGKRYEQDASISKKREIATIQRVKIPREKLSGDTWGYLGNIRII